MICVPRMDESQLHQQHNTVIRQKQVLKILKLQLSYETKEEHIRLLIAEMLYMDVFLSYTSMCLIIKWGFVEGRRLRKI